MKFPRIRFIIPLLYICNSTFDLSGQAPVIPNSGFHLAATPLPLPAAYQNPVINYVRIWEPNMPTTDVINVTGTARTTREVRQTTSYTDGINRNLQTVVKGGSTSGKDLVSPQTFDAYGRQPVIYLPYVQTTGNTNDGKFKNSPFSSQQAFSQDPALNPSGSGESIFYGQQKYEETPSSPLIKSFSPGNTWANEGGQKSNQQYLFVNTVTDSVRVWDLVTGVPRTLKTYDPGVLGKSVSIDENGVQYQQFYDKEGKLILKKSLVTSGTVTAHIGWLCTYFVYDELDNLRFVIPPLAVEKIIPSWTITNVLSGLCTSYRYDVKGRLIVTKLPGVDSSETVYDTRDRPVLVRDAGLKSKGQWLVNFYDNLNRSIRIAAYAATTNRDALQTAVNATLPGTFPFIPAGNLTDLSFQYYDDNYSFPGVQPALTTDFGMPQKGTNYYDAPLTGVSHRVMGLPTGQRTRILGTTQWLTKTIYYNDKGRPIQLISDNIYGGKQTVTSLYDYNGKLLSSYIRQTNPHSTVTPETRVLSNISYDDGGQVIEISTQLNDLPASKRIVGSYSYDEIGNLRTKKVGVINSVPKETLTYDYNINGNLTGINKTFVNTPNSTSNWFGEELAFDFGFSVNQYNGTIAGAKWKSRGDGIARASGYSYDKSGRLLAADFSQQNAGSTLWTSDKVDFSLRNLSYDANGNIGGLLQKGMKGLSIAVVDSLKYGYLPNSNQLYFVTDRQNDPQSGLRDFKEINNNETQDYVYDAAGNLTTDMNRLLAIKPNLYLNVPDSLTVLGKGYIAYTYDAAGNKLRKKVTDLSGTGSVTTTDYVDGFIYQNDSLVSFDHDEGRIRVLYASGQAPTYVYDYFIADHIGNIRMVLTEQYGKATYAATMETAFSAKENALFANINSCRTNKPAGYPVDATTNPNDYVAKLNASAGSQKIGPSLVLRVMAGDSIQLGSKAFYKSAAASTSNTTVANMLAALLQAFATGTGPSDGAHGNGTGTGSPIASNFTSANYQAIRDKDPSQNVATLPKAYLAYVLFDDQMNMVDENSGVRQVQGSPDQLQTLATSLMIMKKTGFLYVYTTNESIQDVYFDNIVVNHNAGPLLEETHYYPFGLTMAGISSKALKNPYITNNFNYNGIEQTDEIGLNQYDAFFRTLDPQLGRWNQMDPVAEKYPGISPYNSNFNNPVSISDPLGDDPPIWGLFNGQYGWGYGAVNIVTHKIPFITAQKVLEVGMQFQTNGFNQIGDYVTRQQQRQRYELQKLQSLQRSYDIQTQIDLQQSQQIEVKDGFAVRQYEDPSTTGAAWRRGMGKVHKSFIFVTDYVEPVVTGVTTMGLEGLATAAVVSGVTRSSIIRAAGRTGRAASHLKKILPSWKKVIIDIDHIASGHIRGGNRISNLKTLFPEWMNAKDVSRVVRNAYRNVHTKLQTQGDRILLRGTGFDGLEIEMWLNKVTNTIETAYPIY
ncbi:DUF6443 domain-containing protein [Chitinophaga sp. ARDCPP14]|uniref:DUF6443 domain-containing protein n=1 Tax=Chitinophaga sp. ARDCPP14 TaxID=3391139 RepID=UPI003F523115